MFQSSPGRRTGCNRCACSNLAGLTLFQSSPGRRTGCNRGLPIQVDVVRSVSILTRSSDRMQRTLFS